MPAYDPTWALIVVDVQNDFADPSGSLSVKGGRDVIRFINDEIAAARDAGATIAYTQDWHPLHTPHFVTDGGVWPVHCVKDTWGAELHPDLDVAGPAIRKGSNGEDGYSGFSMRDPVTGETEPTQLDDLLREGGVGRVAICGLATDYCVLGTALDAIRLVYATTVLTDGIAAVDVQPGDGVRAIDELRAAGADIQPDRS